MYVCVCARMLRIVSRDKILRLENTFIIIIIIYYYYYYKKRNSFNFYSLLPLEMGLLSSDFQWCIWLDLEFCWCDAAGLTGGSEKHSEADISLFLG